MMCSTYAVHGDFCLCLIPLTLLILVGRYFVATGIVVPVVLATCSTESQDQHLFGTDSERPCVMVGPTGTRQPVGHTDETLNS